MRSLSLGVLLLWGCAGVPRRSAAPRAAETPGPGGDDSRVERRRVALVIGNGQYPGGFSLLAPANDARAVGEKLRELGFATRVVLEADLAGMRASVRAFAATIAPGDLALVFYAGYGARRRGTFYLLPVDLPLVGAAAPSLADRALSVDELSAELAPRRGTNVLLIDACRTNPRNTPRLYSGAPDDADAGELAPMRTPARTLLAYANDPALAAGEAAVDHSPFTSVLLPRLGLVADFLQVLYAVRDEVWLQTWDGQRPYVTSSLGAEPVVLTAESPEGGRSTPEAARQGECPVGMVWIRGGAFLMGQFRAWGGTPVHPVRVSGFCMDRTEVSVDAFRQCVEAGACTAPGAYRSAPGALNQYCNWDRDDRGAYPVNCLDGRQPEAFCAWRRARLPTEAEWEYAARGTEGRTYPWGFEEPDSARANLCGDECVAYRRANGLSEVPSIPGHRDDFAGTAPVESFPLGATPEGLLNMAGNVWERVADWYGPYPESAETDPAGAPEGRGRVIRGGCWIDHFAVQVRAASRHSAPPESGDAATGFRCARGAP